LGATILVEHGPIYILGSSACANKSVINCHFISFTGTVPVK